MNKFFLLFFIFYIFLLQFGYFSQRNYKLILAEYVLYAKHSTEQFAHILFNSSYNSIPLSHIGLPQGLNKIFTFFCIILQIQILDSRG